MDTNLLLGTFCSSAAQTVVSLEEEAGTFK